MYCSNRRLEIILTDLMMPRVRVFSTLNFDLDTFQVHRQWSYVAGY